MPLGKIKVPLSKTKVAPDRSVPHPEKARRHPTLNGNGAAPKPKAKADTTATSPAEYFEVIGRATNDAVRDWDIPSGALFWPRGLESLLQYPVAPAHEVGFWFSHLHPEDLSRIRESLRSALAGTADRWMGEYRFLRADGVYLHILERAHIARDAEGRPVRAVCVMMDVTERKQLQEQACRSQRMEAFGQLAGGVAHDFNNFLTTILGYSDLILSENAVKGQLAQQITEIRDAAGRASSLTNQLLAFSRRQALEPAVLEINHFITRLEESLLHLLGENISISCHLHPFKDGGHVQADPGQLTQIILNLALNARDAMRESGGCLTLETTLVRTKASDAAPCGCADLPPGDYVSIRAADNGPGMSEEVKARLFEPFFTTRSDKHRSGLGLAASYGIVRQSGGHICAESKLGEGTTFRIFLPRVPAPPPPAYRRRGATKSLAGTESILVLEDDVSVRHLSVRVLRRLGYEVIEAAGGADAKRLVQERGARRIDLLLTDLMLPEMSGRDFAAWLRLTSPETKVVFVSGYLEESLHPAKRRDPEVSFLAKPFTAGELAEKVRDVLDAQA